jgi:hypothetical protein
MYAPAFPKPKQMKRKPKAAVNIYRDGREVCDLTTKAGYEEYKRRIEVMRIRQEKKCYLCGYFLRKDEATFDHQDGRGHGGGHRDDRIEKDGKPYNGAAHFRCNASKGSVRLNKFLAEELQFIP